MKKIIVCMICICIALAGCRKEKSLVKEKKQKEVLLLATKGKDLILKNLISQKIVNKYKLGKKQCTGSIIELDQGYCVQIYEANRELKNQVIQGAVVEDTPDESEIVKASIKLFDKKLKETDTVDITRLAKERKDEDLLMTSFTVSPDGTKIAWNTGENILCYNRETKKFTKYNQITKKDITAENIIFAGNDKLAFYGTKGESEEDTCYGYFDLKNKKIHTFIEKKYEAFSLNVDKRYIWINDGENPNTKTASGKVPVIDTKTGKNHLVHLDGIESAKALLIKENSSEYEQINKIFDIIDKENLVSFINSASSIYESKDDIYNILDYINILLDIKIKQNTKDSFKYAKCIFIVEEVKKRLRANSNYDMSVDYLLMNMWKEINSERSSRY